jgi:hypothetical protein
MDVKEAKEFWQVEGDHSLGAHVLSMLSFMVRKNGSHD